MGREKKPVPICPSDSPAAFVKSRENDVRSARIALEFKDRIMYNQIHIAADRVLPVG